MTLTVASLFDGIGGFPLAMSVTLYGIEFPDEAARDAALAELGEALERINEAERQAWRANHYLT